MMILTVVLDHKMTRRDKDDVYKHISATSHTTAEAAAALAQLSSTTGQHKYRPPERFLTTIEGHRRTKAVGLLAFSIKRATSKHTFIR